MFISSQIFFMLFALLIFLSFKYLNSKYHTYIYVSAIICFMIHFQLLEAYFGVACCILEIVRFFVFKKFENSNIIYLYLAYTIINLTLVINSLIFCKTWFSCLPGLTFAIYSYLIINKNYQNIKYSIYVASLFNLIYSIFIGSFAFITVCSALALYFVYLEFSTFIKNRKEQKFEYESNKNLEE